VVAVVAVVACERVEGVACERVEGVALVVLALVLPAALHTRRPRTVELHWVA
jgi:hypothetical protein